MATVYITISLWSAHIFSVHCGLSCFVSAHFTDSNGPAVCVHWPTGSPVVGATSDPRAGLVAEWITVH